jgi:thiamine-phosphate pyrophosphorylase
MRGLYAIVDTGVLAEKNLDALAFARAMVSARPAALQIRAKELSARETLALLRALVPLCRQARVPLVANDRPDLAVLAGCDLVHIGQDDVPVALARRIAPGLGLGISTHTLEQLECALAARPAYVAYGPVFATASKTNAEPVGVDGLRQAAVASAKAGIPLVAIGGIDAARAPEIASIAPCAAMITALVTGVTSAAAAAERAIALHLVLRGGIGGEPPPASVRPCPSDGAIPPGAL